MFLFIDYNFQTCCKYFRSNLFCILCSYYTMLREHSCLTKATTTMVPGSSVSCTLLELMNRVKHLFSK